MAVFLLDTNVVSELMRDAPDPNVLLWMDGRPTRDLFVTAVTEAEIRTGVAVLPDCLRAVQWPYAKSCHHDGNQKPSPGSLVELELSD